MHGRPLPDSGVVAEDLRGEQGEFGDLVSALEHGLAAARANRSSDCPAVELLIELAEATLVAAQAAAGRSRCPSCALREVLAHVRAVSTTARFALAAAADHQRAAGLPVCRGEHPNDSSHHP
ncbi:hypothetical protein [Saccharopolyspora sp. NPDC050642]|uniref:hypothetical protein n=1 Tax=Saccharopolyspora sp. NPDC050642 TaxID=3157099 RepID=UPI0033FFDF00